MDNKNKMEKLMTPLTIKFLLCISHKNNYLLKITREIGCTYSHTIKIVDRLSELKIINKKKEGRKNKIKLTEKGIKIQQYLNEIKILL